MVSDIAAAVIPGEGLQDASALAAAVAAAAPGDTLVLAAARFDFDSALVLTRPLTLRGLNGKWPVLHFTAASAALRVEASGCALRTIVLTASGHRSTPMLQLSGADGVTVEDVVLWAGEGSGLHAEACNDLRVVRLVAAELGMEAASVVRCGRVSLDGVCRSVGRRLRASALKLVDTRDFDCNVDVDDVSGSAVSVQAQTGLGLSGRVAVRASRCFRALSVLGEKERPANGVTATVTADTFTDCGVLLANAQGIDVSIVAGDHGEGPVLRLDGVAGARFCTLRLATGGSEGNALESRGGSGENAIEHRRRDHRVPEREVTPSEALPEQARWVTDVRPQKSFDAYEVAGTCSLCGWQGRFRRSHVAVRETLACGNCRATLRYRGQAEALLQAICHGQHATLAQLAASGGLAGLAIFEPGVAGPLRAYLSQAGGYRQSFYEPGLPSGTLRDGIECQDLMATSYQDGCFDLVVTSDIFEHIRKPFEAFAEVRRILKPGGAHVFTVPFTIPPLNFTRSRVDTSGSEDRHLLPPVYHGSGTNGTSLVYTDFGLDIVVRLAQLGMRTEAVRHYGRSRKELVTATFISYRDI